MKMTKIALLASAALVAVSMGARADDLSDLKARIAALEANAATTSVPAGYQLMTIGSADAIVIPGIDDAKKGYGKKAIQISVLPTADMPASTNIQWSGYVKAAIVYTSKTHILATSASSYSSNVASGVNLSSLDIKVKSGMKVVGTTDTAVGEVGVRLAFVGDYTNDLFSANGSAGKNRANPLIKSDGVWGWWKISPELTLAGGRDGSPSGNGYGYDGACKCIFTGDGSGGYGNGDAAQMRLSYASGPISAAIAIEDNNNLFTSPTSAKSAFGVGAEIKYSGDMFNGEISAGWLNDAAGTSAAWDVNAGVAVTVGDIATLSVAAGTGNKGFFGLAADDFTKASALVKFNLSDVASAEVAVSHAWNGAANDDVTAYGGGIYWTPVSQLTIGLEAAFKDNEASAATDTTTADLVTVFSF